MGTWIGHFAPGVFFVFFAFWWHIHNCIRYFKSRASEGDDKTKRGKYKFQGSTTYPCLCLPKRVRQFPCESIMKILITSIHFSIEVHDGFSTEPIVHLGDENAHHTAMLFGFFLGSWVEILVYYKFPFPPRITQVMGFLAFAMEGLMMAFHLHARSMVDAHIHVLLAMTIILSMIGALGECFDPNNFWFIVGRSFFALTQGTWFLQASFVIWPKSTSPYFVWDMNSHRSVSILTMCYAYHMAGNAFLLILVYLLVHLFMKSTMKLDYNQVDDEPVDGYKLILNGHDEDNGL